MTAYLTHRAFERSEEDDREDQVYYQAYVDNLNVWLAKWPNFCRSCGGWGVHHYTMYHDGPRYPGEHMMDPCDCTQSRPEGPQKCPRCAELGLWNDCTGPCSFCGWNYDDGYPEL